MNMKEQQMAAAWCWGHGFQTRPMPSGIRVRIPEFNPRTGEWSEVWHDCPTFTKVREAAGFGAPTEGEA